MGVRSPSPGHWRATRPSPRPTGPCSTGSPSRPTAPPTASGPGWCSTASSTRPTSGSTAPTWATPRATSSATPSRSPTSCGTAPSTSWPSRSTCSPPGDRTAKRNLTGVFQHWDCIDPDLNPGGIWRPVRLERTGPIRLRRLSVVCTEAGGERPRSASGPSPTPRRPASSRSPPPSAGTAWPTIPTPRSSAWPRARTSWSGWSTVPEPKLWWPWALGTRPLRRHRRGHRRGRARSATPSSARSACGRWCSTTGSCRSTASASSSRGPTWARPAALLGEATDEDVRRDVDLAKDAGLDLRAGPRPHRHPGPLRPGRRAGDARVAGPAPPVGLRPLRAQAGRAPGPQGGRPPRPPSVDRHLVRAQRAAGPRRDHRPDGRPGGPAPGRREERPGHGAADLEQDRARPLHQAGPGEGRRLPAGHPPQRRLAPPPSPRRDRQPPLLRLVPRRRAGPARLRRHPAPHGPLRDRVRGPGRSRERRVHGAGAMARPRLGAPGGPPLPAADVPRPPGARGRPRHLRLLAGRHPGLPGDGHPPPRRGAAPPEVPADRRVRPVPADRPPTGRHLVGAGPRAGAQGRLQGACRRRAAP